MYCINYSYSIICDRMVIHKINVYTGIACLASTQALLFLFTVVQ